MPNEIVVSDQTVESADKQANLPVFDDDFVPAPSSARRAEIEAVMHADRRAYFRKGLDKELAELLRSDVDETANDKLSLAAGLVPLPADQSRGSLLRSEAGRQLVETWHGLGSFERGLRATQQAVGGLLQGIGDERAQRAFMESFDRSLPEKLRYAVYEVISTGGGGFVRPADKQGLERFSKDTMGAELVKQWGARAGEKVARVWQKTQYLQNACGDLSAGFEWFNTLTDKEAKSVLEYLAR